MRLSYLIQARRRHMTAVLGRKPRISRRLPRALFPTGVELSYRRTLLGLVRTMQHEVARRLFPSLERASLDAQRLHRRDAVSDDFGLVKVDLLEGAFSGPNARRLAQPVGERTSEWQKAQLERQLRAAVGVELPIGTPEWQPRIDAFTEENVGLIRSMPEEYLGQVQKLVLRGLADGSRWEDMVGEIARRGDVADSRAALIARDQVGKFYSSLNAARQTDLGITHFFWQTDNDERTCPICAPLDGRRFAWNNPPADGGPGEIHPQCRCSGSPDVEALLDGL